MFRKKYGASEKRVHVAVFRGRGWTQLAVGPPLLLWLQPAEPLLLLLKMESSCLCLQYGDLPAPLFLCSTAILSTFEIKHREKVEWRLHVGYYCQMKPEQQGTYCCGRVAELVPVRSVLSGAAFLRSTSARRIIVTVHSAELRSDCHLQTDMFVSDMLWPWMA